MAFNINDKSGNKERTLIPAKTHLARFIGYVEVGKHEQRPFQGQAKKPANEAILTFEFPKCLHTFREEDGPQPMIYSKVITLFNDAKSNCMKIFAALREAAKAHNPKAENAASFVDLLGTTTLNKMTIENGYNRLSAEGILPTIMEDPLTGEKKVYQCPKQIMSTVVFDWENPSLEVYENLFQWQQDKIGAAINFKGSSIEALISSAMAPTKSEDAEGTYVNNFVTEDDDIPF